MLTLNTFLQQLQAFHDETDDFTAIYDNREDYVHDDIRGNSLKVEGMFKNLCIKDIDIHIEERGKVSIVKTETFLLNDVEDRGFSTFDVDDYVAETTIGSKEIIVAETTILDFEEYIDFIEDYAQQLEIEIEVAKEHKRLDALGKKYRKERASLMTGFELTVDPEDGFVERKMVSVYFRNTMMNGIEIISHALGFNHLTEQNVFNFDDAVFTTKAIIFENLGRTLELPLFESVDRFIDDKVWHDEEIEIEIEIA